jgi:hypothetical protein
MKHKPKKAKLITQYGFQKIIKIKDVVSRIQIPMMYNFTMTPPELYGIQVNPSFMAVFEIEKITKKYAIYKQIDVIQKLV